MENVKKILTIFFVQMDYVYPCLYIYIKKLNLKLNVETTVNASIYKVVENVTSH